MAALVLVHNRPIPSGEANTVAITRMAEAFAALGLEVSVTSYAGDGDAAAHYGLSGAFALRAAPDVGGPLRYPTLVARALRAGPPGAAVYTRIPQAAIYAALAGRQVILEMHTPIGVVRRGAWSRRGLNVLAGRLAAVVAVNRRLGEVLAAELPAYRGQVIVAPSGAQDLSPPPGAPPPDHDLGYIGSANPGKGAELVVEVAAQRPAARVLIAGRLPAGLAARASALSNVTLAGEIAPSRVAETLARFRIGLAPYAERVQGAGASGLDLASWMSPLKVVEYFSAGKAVVASRLAAVEELATDGLDALLPPPDDIGAWLQALDVLLADPRRTAALAAAGRERFDAGLSWDRRAARIAAAAALIVPER